VICGVSPDDRLLLQDIRDAWDRVIEYSRDLTYENFTRQHMPFDAIVRRLEIIGEAVRHVSSGLQARHSEIDWRRINALRNVLIHQYSGI
jgi:uncharacterized protein with HEPN domain